MRGQRVEVHVRTLVLDGAAAVGGRRVGDELAAELTRLLAANDQPVTAARPLGSVEGGTLELGRTPIEAAIGAQVARTVHGRLRS
jgi:hypothetical protein